MVYPCTPCKKDFDTLKALYRHVRSNPEEHVQMLCDNCDRVFTDVKEREEHHLERYECIHCIPVPYESGDKCKGRGPNVFCTLRDMTQHFCDRHVNVCSDCSEEFDNRGELVNHVMDKHLPGKVGKLVIDEFPEDSTES